MARGLNKVMLIGNLGNDPEIRHTNSGMAVATLSLATAESWKDRDSGETRDKTEWHRVVFFGRVAEVAEQYLRKGSQIYIEGRLQTRKWQDRDGNDRYTTEIVGNDMQMLGGGRKSATDENFKDPEDTHSSSDGPREVSSSGGTAGSNTFIEDDIPF